MEMIITIAIILIALTVACFAGAIYSFARHKKGIAVGAALMGVIMALAVLIVPLSLHVIQSGEVAVVKHMGKVKDEERMAGTYFDFWITDKYEVYDATVQTVDLTFSAYSADAQTMDVTMTLQYQIIPEKASDVATQYGTLSILQNRITSVSTEKAKSVLSKDKAMDIIANRAQMSPAVEESIIAAIGENYFVNVVAVVLTDLTFTDAFELAVEEKMIAEQAKLKAEYDNQTKVAQAQAEADAKLAAATAEIEIAQAQADAELKKAQAKVEIAKAEAEAKKVAAEAEAEANRIIAESLTPEILDKIMADKWDGKLPTVVAGADSSMGMMLPHVAEPSRLKEARVTPVEASGTTRPAFWTPRKAMNRPIPAGIAALTALGIASKIMRRRPVTVRRTKIRPSARTKSRALA